MERFEYDPQKGRFRSWLSTIVHNEIRRHQSKSRLPLAEPQWADSSPSTQVWDEEFHAHVLATALARIQDRFEPRTWQAFLMTWVDLCDATEVAQQLEMSIDQVYLAKCRVLKRLRQEVATLADDGL